MNNSTLNVARFWFRASFSRRWTSYLSLVLLIGLVGGIALGSEIASRRTSSSYNVFLASTNPSNLSIIIGTPNLTQEFSKLPLVRHVGTADFDFGAIAVGHNGKPVDSAAMDAGDVVTIGGLRGIYFSQDKVAVTQGRMANPKKLDEFVMTPLSERLMHYHVGESIPMDFYTGPQTDLPGFGTSKVKPTLQLTMKLVGTVVLNDEVVLDEVDRYPSFMIFTPALSRSLQTPGPIYIDYGLQTVHGSKDVPAVEREIIKALPPGTTYSFEVASDVAAQVNRSIEPEAIALGIFGLIAALAALIIAGSLIARVLQSEGEDLGVLRALGAPPSMVASSVLLGVLGAVIAGALLALIVGEALSFLSPIGPVRPFYPVKGFNFDWYVLGIGFVIIIVVLGGVALLLARRRAMRFAARSSQSAQTVGSKAARRLADLGLPITLVAGVRFAIEPGKERDAVPVRSALLGSVLAVLLVVATVTFGSGLNTLITHPALYGWNWNYALNSGGADIPPQSLQLLRSDPFVDAFSGAAFANVQIDGVTTPVLLMRSRARVSPPLISGHDVDGPDQIVLGAATMAQLHEHLGGTVMASYGSKKDAPVYVPPTRLRIVGVATLPAVGQSLTSHTSMGDGAVISSGIEPPAMAKFLTSKYPALNGPKMVFVRVKNGVSRKGALASFRPIDKVGDKVLYAVPDGEGSGDGLSVMSVQYPAEIENYRTIGNTPTALALGLALGAAVALGLTLTASVRRRRRDLAMLRALGFTGRQLRATIAWQATVAGVVGVVVGLPLGIELGRWLWTLFAGYIDAVPRPTVPTLRVLMIAIVTIVLVNLVAALPGRIASRVSTAQVLRGE